MEEKSENQDQSAFHGIRRVPRRHFQKEIGVLLHGDYFKCQALELGEGGMLIVSDVELEKDKLIVVSVNVPSYARFVIRAKVVYIINDKNTGTVQYGLEFVDLGFDVKRFIRSFVAQATEEERNQTLAA